VFETHKSFVLNEMFRRDLYAKLPAEPLPADVRAGWDDVVFGPLVLGAELRLEHAFPVGRVGYTDPIYPVLANLLLARTWRFGDLCAAPELAGHEPLRILHSLHYLCGGGQFGTFRAPLPAVPGEASGPWRLTLPLNRVLLRERLLADGRTDVASGVVGTGVRLGMIAGLFALGADATGEEHPVEWAMQFLREHDHTLKVEGRVLANEQEQRDVLVQRFAEFRRDRLRLLAAFGIMEPGLAR
jgi:hypothetical protein